MATRLITSCIYRLTGLTSKCTSPKPNVIRLLDVIGMLALAFGGVGVLLFEIQR